MSIEITTQFSQITCRCGGAYALPNKYLSHCEAKRLDWHCPFCQVPWGYGHLKQRDRNEINRLNHEKEHLAERLQREKEAHRFTEYQRRGEKAAKTKLRKRIKGGACPCCKRTFQNLQRHIASKHPDFPSE